jgi:predicted AAA+ superfamily ATPase
LTYCETSNKIFYMRIPRIYDDLGSHLRPGKVLVLFGPRQVGKTTILRDYLGGAKWKYRLDVGDDIRLREVLGSSDLRRILEYAQGYELLAIDEAQRIPRIGESLKILVDQMPTIRIIVTGSSSFELSGQIGEPLTGRKHNLILFPVSQLELASAHNPYDLKQQLEEYLVFGGYPEVLTTASRSGKAEVLNEITGSYLLKDVLELDRIKSSKTLLDLLRLLAFQIGKEVSWSELAAPLGIDGKTVARYLDILEKSFVLYNLRGYSRNLRKEIVKKGKYYFYDNGVRNSLIASFNPLEQRNDVGALWENFLVVERLKRQAYRGPQANNYFWRTWDKQEIDFVEEREGRLYGFEFKWGAKKTRAPKDWLAAYPEAQFAVIDPTNYLDFICG